MKLNPTVRRLLRLKPAAPKRKANAVVNLGTVPGIRPVKVWLDLKTGQVCFREHRRRTVRRRSLEQMWQDAQGQRPLL